MTAPHRRAARREREAADVLGGERVRYRPRYVSAPDVRAVVLPSGVVLSVEVKTRKRLPSLLAAALEQARRYQPSAVPCAVVSETGGRALAVLDLRDLALLVGLAADALNGPRSTPKRRRAPAEQLELGVSGAPSRRG